MSETLYSQTPTWCDNLINSYELPYRRSPAFWEAYEGEMVDYDPNSFEAQAYDRGLECRGRVLRMIELVGVN